MGEAILVVRGSATSLAPHNYRTTGPYLSWEEDEIHVGVVLFVDGEEPGIARLAKFTRHAQLTCYKSTPNGHK